MSQAPKKKILVVDDNVSFLDMVHLVLGDEFEILKAENGAEGVEIAQREAPDVILLDVMMPKVSGVEMLRELQADLETRRIPVIVLTASKLDDSTLAMIRHEINVKSFLRKPCGAIKLRDEIRLALEGASRE